MLVYVENGVQNTNDYVDIDEPFYNSDETVYRHVLMLMKKERSLEQFGDRVRKVMDKTEGIGWGFHDDSLDLYGGCYRANKRKSKTGNRNNSPVL